MPRKGRSGAKRKFDDEYHRVIREKSKESYYKHHERALIQRRDYHKKIKDYATEHKISFEEAMKELAKLREQKESE